MILLIWPRMIIIAKDNAMNAVHSVCKSLSCCNIVLIIYVARIVLFEGTTRREMSLKDNCWSMKMLKRGCCDL